jgi:hypothetical protein
LFCFIGRYFKPINITVIIIIFLIRIKYDITYILK